MPARWEKRAKCPNCLPDVAGAYFKLVSVADDKLEWKCNNCGHGIPFVRHKASNQPTQSQESIITLLKNLGWAVEFKMIGRNVWVTGRKERGSLLLNLYSGDTFYGAIGVRGSFKLTLSRIGGDKILTDRIGIDVYLK